MDSRHLRAKAGRVISIAVRLVVLGIIVVGVPSALVVLVGSPSRLPTELEVRAAFSGAGDEFDRALLYGMAAVVALVWFQVVVAVATAAVARVRRRTPRRPRLVPRALHRLAVNLVSGVTVVSIATTVVTELPAASSAVIVDQPTAIAGHHRTVGSRETWWSLAVRHLGDGRRWREVAALNPGVDDDIPSDSRVRLPGGGHGDREYVVAEGDDFWTIARRITRSEDPAVVAEVWIDLVETNRDRLVDPDDPDVIHPGVVVVLPSTRWLEHWPPIEPGASIADNQDPDLAAAPVPPVSGAPSAGPPVLEVPVPAAPVPPVSGAPTAEPPVSGAPTAEPPVLEVPVPAAPVPPVLEVPVPAAPVPPVSGAPTAEPPVLDPGAPTAEPPVLEVPVPAAPVPPVLDPGAVNESGLGAVLTGRFGPEGRLGDVAAGASATALGVALHGLTRRRGRRGTGDSRRPVGQAGEGERSGEKAPAADHPDGDDHPPAEEDPRTDDIDAVVAGLRVDAPGVEIFGLAVADRITVLLVSPRPEAPPGISVRDEGWSWELGEESLRRFRSAVPGVACEPYVALGDHGTGGRLFVNLARFGHLRLRGSWVDVRPFGVALVTGLVDRGVEVAVVDPVGDVLGDRVVHGVTVHPTLAALLDDDSDADSRRVVVDLLTDEPGALDRLDSREGALAVTANGRAEWVAEVDGDVVRLEPLGVEVNRTDVASPPGESGGSDPTSPQVESVAGARGRSARGAVDLVAPAFVAARRAVETSAVVEIKVLGVVDVVGAAHRFTSPAALELVTYLAFHREGADADRLKRWVWPPDEPPGDRAFANVLWRARRALGCDADGSELLPRIGADRCYRLADEVTTDFAIAERHIAAAGNDRDESAIAHLRSAVALVRGAPFAGPGFAWSDHVVRAHVEYVMGDTAHRLADLAVGIGDLGVARWAVHQGLLVMPGCEDCYRRRLLIADAAGRPSELRATMAELQRVAESEGDVVAPDLVELYRDLRHSGVA